jgi:hypothetical protein
MSCASAADAGTLHVSTDRLAVIQRPVTLAEWGLSVDALHLTALLPANPKVILNVESDDCGVLANSQCDCFLGRCGFHLQLSQVRSYRRLTAEGVTLVHARAVRVIEELLPARFGGTPLDYQLLEEETADGSSRLTLLVSPHLDFAEPDEFAALVLDELSAGDGPAVLAAAFWRRAGTLSVLPGTGRHRSGKQLPIVIAGIGPLGAARDREAPGRRHGRPARGGAYRRADRNC